MMTESPLRCQGASNNNIFLLVWSLFERLEVILTRQQRDYLQENIRRIHALAKTQDATVFDSDKKRFTHKCFRRFSEYSTVEEKW